MPKTMTKKEMLVACFLMTGMDKASVQLLSAIFEMMHIGNHPLAKTMMCNIDEFLNRLAGAAATVYTEEEVKALFAFYKTEHGAAIAKKTPQLSMLSMKVGQEMGAEIARGVYEMQESNEYDN